MGILREKGQKIFLEGFGEEKYKYFKPRQDIQQLTRLLLQIYVTIFGHFKGKSQKKLFYKALEKKNTSISSPDRIFNSWQGFYCSFMWQYLDILMEKAKKKFILEGFWEEKHKYFKPRPDIQQLTRLLLQIYVTIFGHFKGKSQKNLFYKALEKKNTSISSPDRIFNSWQGFYCRFMWQYLDILREKAKKNYFTRLWTGKIQVFQAPTGYSTADKAFIAVLCDNIWAFWGKKAKKIF